MMRILLFVLAAVLSGCASNLQRNAEAEAGFLSSLYNPSERSLHPDYFVYHENERFSVLYIRAYPSELRFSQTNEDSEYRAMLNISYQLSKLDEEGVEESVVDSSAVTYKLRKVDEKRPAFFASLSIPVQQGGNYLLRLEARDLVRGNSGIEYVYIDKRGFHKAQQFKVFSLVTGYPKFMPFFNPGERFNILYSDASADSLFLTRYSMDQELPRAPLNNPSAFRSTPLRDTLLAFPVADTVSFDYNKEGMYVIQADTLEEGGLTLFNFGPSFPQVKTPDELLEPVFYLATMAEYRKLREAPNRKLAVDNYWLKLGGSIEKSRELIRIYYNRVIYSNLYFTAHMEGWKSDRGMVFILFGPPSRIQVTAGGERWFYYSRRRSDLVEFRFERKQDPYCNQRLEWVRTAESQSARSEAINSWRNGKVFAMGS